MSGTTDYAAALARLEAWVAEKPDVRCATLYHYDGAYRCCVDGDNGEYWPQYGAGWTFAEAITRALDQADAVTQDEVANV